MRRLVWYPSLLWNALLLLVALLPSSPRIAVEAAYPCQTTRECIDRLRDGSQCINNQCTNPYHYGGCLKQRVTDWTKTRVCHSEDPPEAVQLGYCVPPDPNFDYPEIRIQSQNWESAFFQAWIIQIILSEMLNIPVTLETGERDKTVDFYQRENRLEYGISYDWDGLRRANSIGDCRLVNNTLPNQEYQSCAHVIPEIWYGNEHNWEPMLQEGIIRRPGLGGALGYQGLYIPRFSAAKDTSLLTYLGLAGEENRHKVAAAFLRPTTWRDYCELVSTNNCTNPDDPIAISYPPAADQYDRYNVEGSYKGHFRFTEANNCTLHPKTCTGHIVDYPCGWTSFVKQQMHHLNIALRSDGPDGISGGYSYSQMVEIWAAANATRSNVMMRWWTPEALFQTFLGSDAEFTRVDLPPATQDCIAARISMDDRCREDAPEQLHFGDPGGTCDEPPFALKRLFAKWLVDYSNDPNLPEEIRSPGYKTIDNIQLDGLQIAKIFDYWLKRSSDKYNFDPRDAACRWVSENLVTVQSYLPQTFPRVIEDKEATSNALDYVSIVFSLIAAACVGFSLVGVIWQRKKNPAIILAQVNFLYLLLIGLAMVSMSSILLNVPPSDASCMAITWLHLLGYTFELVPLLFKVAAIASLIAASRKFKRVRLDKKKLYWAVFVVGVVIVIYLILWTCLDPVEKRAKFDLTYNTNDEGETIVERTYHCSSDSNAWLLGSIGWQAILLFCGTVLAFTTRNMRKDMTESLVVSVLVYSHSMFVLLRLILFNFSDQLDAWKLARYSSIIFSADVIAACCIYFFPKLLLEEDKVTRNPIMPSVPAVLLPPEPVRQVFAQVTDTLTRNLPRMDTGIRHLVTTSDDEDPSDYFDGDNDYFDEDMDRTYMAQDGSKRDSLARNRSLPALRASQQEGRPKDLFRDSITASDVQNRSLRFDSLMLTASGKQRPTDILRHSFDFETLQLNSAARSGRSLGSNPPTQSAMTIDTACTTIAEEEIIFDVDEEIDRRGSLMDMSNRYKSLPANLASQTLKEEEEDDEDRLSSISC